MIRNVVLGRLHADADRDERDRRDQLDRLDQGLAGILALDIDGMTQVRVGRDAGLRPGNWDYAITCDFVDAAAYHRYDHDDEHNRLRREYFAPLSAEIARLQFEV